MKNFFFTTVLAAGLFLGSCEDNKTKEADSQTLSTDLVKEDKKAAIKFTNDRHDFGTITAGEVVSTRFEFTNTGEGDLIITKADASCGCTVPDYPKEPIKPGEKGEIEVKYNSTGKNGFEEKTVTIVANTTPPNNVITIAATTQPAPAQ